MQYLPKPPKRKRHKNRCLVWKFDQDGKLEFGMSLRSLENLALGPKAKRMYAQAERHKIAAEAMKLFRQGMMKKGAAAKALGVSKNTLYRALAEYRPDHSPDERDPLLD